MSSVWGASDPTISDTNDYLIPPVVLDVTLNSADVSKYVKSYQISGARGTPISGSIVLKDFDNSSLLVEIISQFYPNNANIKSHNMATTRTISITAKQGVSGPATQYPTLIPTVPTWDNDGECTINFSDMTPVIDLENVSGIDIVRGEGDFFDSSNVIDLLEIKAGQTITPGFSPYQVNVFRLNASSILSALDDLQSPRQAYRKWVGSTLNLEVLTPSATSYSIIDRKHIPEGGATLDKDPSSLKTYFKYIKNSPLNSALSNLVQCTGLLGEESPCVGRVVQVTFNRPADFARIIHKAEFGTITAGVFYDADNNELNPPLTPAEIFYKGGGEPATSWLGTYTPGFSLGLDRYIPAWTARAVGGSYSDLEVVSFEVENTVTEAETEYGPRPEFKDLATELLFDEADAVAMLAAIELEVLWSINKVNINSPWLFPAREGEFISVTHYRLGLSSEQCLLNSWSHSYSYEGGWNNSYNMTYEL